MQRRSFFDRFARRVAYFAGHPMAFAAAVALILLWLVSGPLFKFSDTRQLVINTATTIVTFLMVALLQNTQRRSDEAVQHKLNALADGLADLMKSLAAREDPGLERDLRELRAAVGLEDRESA